jgi:hypothetical protein
MQGAEFLWKLLARPIADLFNKFVEKREYDKEYQKAKERGDLELGPEMSFQTSMQGFELNPDRQEEQVEDITGVLSVLEIQQDCQKFLSQIWRSADRFPYPVIELLRTVQQITEEKNPENAAAIFGSFIFLRFLNPPVVTPEAFGMVPKGQEEILADVRRELLLISKVANPGQDVLPSLSNCLSNFPYSLCLQKTHRPKGPSESGER